MSYTPKNIKDRVALGDDIFILEQLEDNKIRLIPSPTSISEVGTQVDKALLQNYEDSLGELSNIIDCGTLGGYYTPTAWKLGQFQVKRAPAREWASTTYVLLNGEYGLDTTNGVLKVGDGVTGWNALRKVQLAPKVIVNTQILSSDWGLELNIEGFGYKANIVIGGVTSDTFAEVVFSVDDAISGKLAPIGETYNGGVSIYASQPLAITIPTIVCWN